MVSGWTLAVSAWWAKVVSAFLCIPHVARGEKVEADGQLLERPALESPNWK